MTTIDPTAVKAGDTVTLEYRGRTVTAPVSSKPLPEGILPDGWALDVYPDEDTPETFNPNLWTLTDHQPAPGWEPGTTGAATVRGIGDGVRVYRIDHSARGESGWVAATEFPTDRFGVVFEDDEVTDFVPDEARPLPTRDEVAAAIYEAMYGGDWPKASIPATDIYRSGAAAVLALLRGESR